MAKCRKLQYQVTEICAGDLRHKISLKSRALEAPTNNDVDYTETFATLATVYAMVQTVEGSMSGEGLFDSTQLLSAQKTTHNMYIRYRTDITQETWVEYSGKNYDILRVINLEEGDTFLKLECTLRGSTSFEVNEA